MPLLSTAAILSFLIGLCFLLLRFHLTLALSAILALGIWLGHREGVQPVKPVVIVRPPSGAKVSGVLHGHIKLAVKNGAASGHACLRSLETHAKPQYEVDDWFTVANNLLSRPYNEVAVRRLARTAPEGDEAKNMLLRLKNPYTEAEDAAKTVDAGIRALWTIHDSWSEDPVAVDQAICGAVDRVERAMAPIDRDYYDACGFRAPESVQALAEYVSTKYCAYLEQPEIVTDAEERLAASLTIVSKAHSLEDKVASAQCRLSRCDAARATLSVADDVSLEMAKLQSQVAHVETTEARRAVRRASVAFGLALSRSSPSRLQSVTSVDDGDEGEWARVFQSFDKQRKGYLQHYELQSFLMAINQYLPPATLKELTARRATWSCVYQALVDRRQGPLTPESVAEALRVLRESRDNRVGNGKVDRIFQEIAEYVVHSDDMDVGTLASALLN